MAKTLNELPKWAQAEIEEIRLAGTRLWPCFDEPMPIETPHGKITRGWISYGEYYPSVAMVDVEGERKREAGSKYWSRMEGVDVYTQQGWKPSAPIVGSWQRKWLKKFVKWKK